MAFTKIAAAGIDTSGTITTQSISVSGVSTVGSLSIGATSVISSARQLQNIASLDATTTATIESAVANAPNTFTNLNITGISTLGVTSATNLTAQSLNVSGIITATQLSTGASGTGVNITTDTISGPATLTIDPAAVGDNTGAVRIKGDLYVDGTQFIVNSTTIELADFNVGIATTVGTNALLDGAGIGIGSASNQKTLTWSNGSTALKSSEDFDVASGKVYKIAGTSVLSNNTLGSGILTSSLTSVGTLGSLSVSGASTFTSAGDASSGSLNLTSVDPFIRYTISGGTANQSKWDVRAYNNSGGYFTIRTINDANTVFTERLTIQASTGNVTATTFVGALTGNAGTATSLATARTIGGVSFDGTANINLPGVNAAGNQNTSGTAAGLSATLVVASGGTGVTTKTGTGSVVLSDSPTFSTSVGIGTIIDIIPYDTLNSGTLSFEASAGQLFSITNNLTSGSIFSVNDVSGIPSIDVNANGTILLGAYGGNIGVGTTNPTQKLHVVGNASISGSVGIGTASPGSELHIAASSGFAELRLAGAPGSGATVEFYNSATNLGDIFIDASNNMIFRNPSERLRITSAGHMLPGLDTSYDLGSTSLRWRNLYTTDLHLSNEGKPGGNQIDGTTGNWTIQEGEESLYIINNKSLKKYKFVLEEIE